MNVCVSGKAVNLRDFLYDWNAERYDGQQGEPVLVTINGRPYLLVPNGTSVNPEDFESVLNYDALGIEW